MSDYQGNIVIKNPATPTGPNPITGRAPGVWKLNEVAYWLKQGVWPDASADGYWPYVSLLLSSTSLSNANNNLFVDSSGAFNPVSRFGNTTQGSFSPYATNWSNYFDGSGDYFTVPYTTANFDWWTSGVDFTIEAWVFATSLSTWQYTDSVAGVNSVMVGNAAATSEVNYWSFGPLANGTVRFKYYNGANNFVTSTATITANTWNHVAMTKTSSGITVYVNGVAGTTTAISGTPQSSTSYPLIVGQINNATASGYISNLRIVRGTAIYSGNFTPPTAPLTAVTNTTLLTCQSNRFRDASSNNFTITVAGNTSVTDFGPATLAAPGIAYNQSDITNWSGYFDGNGDYLSLESNDAFRVDQGDWTIEAWVYLNTTATNNTFINRGVYLSTYGFYFGTSGTSLYYEAGTGGWSTSATYTSSAGALSAGQWTHIAAVRSGTSFFMYANGTRVLNQASASFGANVTAPVWLGAYVGSSAYLNGSMSNFRFVKGTALYTGATYTVPTAPLTAISGTSLLTCQNAAFTDNSTNNFVITQNGNPTVTGNSPFNTTGYWSNYFDGSGDWIGVTSANAAFGLGTGDFTIEGWVFATANPANGPGTIYDLRSSPTASATVARINSSLQVLFYNGPANTEFVTGTVTLNTWTHIAFVRSSGSLKTYINGTLSNTTSVTSDLGSSQPCYIGVNQTSGYEFNGNISNFRIVKGTAVYTSNFTVPTTPLTAISGTSILTCQASRFIDSSSNAFTLTVTGNTTVQSFDPFYTSTIANNGGSMYFDGSGDYLTVPDSASLNLAGNVFTLEAWIYPNGDYSNYRTIITKRILGGSTTSYQMYLRVTTGYLSFFNGTEYVSSATPIANAWNHVAAVYDGTNINLYLNGTRVLQSATTITNQSANLYIGSFPTYGENVIGYLSDVRVLKGVQAYTGTTYTVPTVPLSPTPATTLLLNGMNAGIYDATAINDMETVGNAQVTTVQSKFGGSSVYFDGTDDRLVIPTTPQFGFGTGDYTIEFWLYMSALPGTKYTLLDFRTASAAQPHTVYVSSSGYMGFYNGSADVTSSSQPLSTNTWYHVAYSRGSGTLKIFVAGTQAYSASNTIDYQATRPLSIGGAVGGIEVLNGYIDDLRITKGVARYTANFTPPTQAFPIY